VTMAAGAMATFRERLTSALETHPGLPRTVRDDGRSIEVEFPKQVASGFDVSLDVSDAEMRLETDRGWHEYWADPTAQDVEHVLGLVRDMLSTACRLRERRAGRRAYRWDLESFVDGHWRQDGTTGLLFWNYFGRRSEQVYQNDTLPARALSST